MVIVSSETVLDVIKDFLALLVISDIDNFFFGEQTPGLVKTIVTDQNLDRNTEIFNKNATTSELATYEDEAYRRGDQEYELPEADQWVIDNLAGLEKQKAIKNKPVSIRIRWQDRPLANKMLYVLYKVLRKIFMVVLFYFVPFLFAAAAQYWLAYIGLFS